MSDDLNRLLTKELANTKEGLWSIAHCSPDITSLADPTKCLLSAAQGLIQKLVKKENRDDSNTNNFEAYESLSGIAISIVGGLAAISLAEDNLMSNQPEEAVRRLCLANKLLGIATRAADIDKEFDASEARIANAKKGAQAKLEKDKKQTAKAEAKKFWQDWRTGKTTHKSGAAFARYIIDKLPVIESEKGVERWATKWRRESEK